MLNITINTNLKQTQQKNRMNNIMFLWQDATSPAAAEGNPLITVAFMLIGIGIFYLFIIRPQAKQQKEEKNFVSNLKKGSKIVTTGGIHGTIVEITEETISLLIAPKTIIAIQKSGISLTSTNSVYGPKKES